MVANFILLFFCNENDGKGSDSKPNFKHKWGCVKNYSLFSFCTFTEKLEALAQGKRSLPTGARSSEVTSLGWQQIRLWTTHMRGSGFWFSISTDLPNSHQWTIFLLFVGPGCLKCKLSEQELSFFAPSVVVGSWLQLRGTSAKVRQTTAPAVREASSAIPNHDPMARVVGCLRLRAEGTLCLRGHFSSLCMAFCNNLEPEKEYTERHSSEIRGDFHLYNTSEKSDP